MAKITFVGAGSVVFNKNLLGDILSTPALQNSIISLHDIDPIRLETAEVMARSIAQKTGANPIIQASLDRRKSLDGSQYVINMIGVGGHAATLIDFDIPRRYGLRQTIGDTHGVGGMFRALRTIPVLLAIARDMEEVCPHAQLLNYTNPMSILVWTLFKATSIRTVGLCHSVQGTVQQLAKYMELPFNEFTYQAAGINHISWILKLEHCGEDAYPILRKIMNEGRFPVTDQVRGELFRRLGYYVTESSEHMAEYLPYFIPRDEEILRLHIPIDEYIRRSEKGLREFEELRNRLMRGDPFEIKRSNEYASLIINSMETGQPSVIYGNVRNSGLIENLPHGCCVEVPCLVDHNGVQPLHVGKLPTALAAVIQPHVAVQDLVVQAALEGKREYLYQAAMLDPLASASLPLEAIWSMVDDLISAHGDALPAGIRSASAAQPFATDKELLLN